MRRNLYIFGWALLIALPIIYGIQIYLMQDLPRIEPWKWLVLFGTVGLIFFTRDRDDVLKHHIV